MKKIVLLLLVLAGVGAHAQEESPYKYLKIEDGDVIFENVYNLDSLSASQIEVLLKERLPGVKNFMQFNAGREEMTGQLQNCYIDAQKYGGKIMTTAFLLGYPMTAAVAVNWKDGKYRVVVSRMQWAADMMLMGVSTSNSISADETLYSKRGWKKMRNITSTGVFIEKYLADLFSLKSTTKKDW